MKKRAAVLLIGLGMVVPDANAAGPYDGIWQVTQAGALVAYYSAHENGGTVIAAALPYDNSYWEAFMGQRSGATATLTTVVSGVTATMSVTFTSDTTLTARQVSCVANRAGWQCLFPNGTTFQGTKIF